MMPRSRPLRAFSPWSMKPIRLALPAFVLLTAGSLGAGCGGGGDSATSSGQGQGGAGGTMATASVGAGTMSNGSATASGTGGGSGSCMTDADCTVPGKTVCDPSTGQCVGCLPSSDNCPMGQYCNPGTNTCTGGCADTSDCTAPLVCDTTHNQCVGCLQDPDCPAGEICFGNSCYPGCSAQQSCPGGQTCCVDQCVDLQNDPLNCGNCSNLCPAPDHANAACMNGMCGLGTCDTAYADCNNDPNDGCEWNILQDGPCACMPSDTMSCYQGAPGTLGVGPCVAGTQTCNAMGTAWGPCIGQVLPSYDICANNVDEDCDGTTDNGSDGDGDGYGPCDGDCCDSISDGCVDPKLVNPGAFDFTGDNYDDDCDGIVDNGVSVCDNGLASNSNNALDYAKAIDLCATTTENPPLPQRKWGVISADLLLADGTGTPAVNSRAIRPGFGQNVGPQKGMRLAVLSSGHAADSNDNNPPFAAFETGQAMLTTSPAPADWLAANGNNLPNAPGCPDPTSTAANDPVMLKVRVRVPTNAKSFNVSIDFHSAEYPEYVCTAFNDFFLTLLDSNFVPGPGETPNPADKNLAFYDPPPAGPPFYPVGVNLATNDTGLFKQCKNGQLGCAGFNLSNTSSCVGTNQLNGTGFDTMSASGCGNNNLVGGATGWLITSGNVTPGETAEIRFVIWDTSDHVWDSLVLIDNFVWSAAPAQPGTHN